MDRDVLLRAICQRPDDDAPRAVYADWLEAHGDSARAEFIRVQLALARLSAGSSERTPLQERQWALLREHRQRWEDELPELPDRVAWGEYRRGFIEGVVASAAAPLRAQGEAVLQQVPLKRLMLANWQPGQSLQGSALLAAVRDLVLLRNTFYGAPSGVDDRAFAEILAWPELARLDRLEIRELDLTPEGTAALRRDLPALEAFSWQLQRGRLDVQSVTERLASTTWARGLRELSLGGLALTGAPLRLLCGEMSRLRCLSLPKAGLGDEDAVWLARSGALQGLQRLELPSNQIGPAGVRALISALPEQAVLLLEDNPLGDEGVALLAGSPLLRQLRELRLRGGSVGDEGMAALAASPYAHELQTIYLPHQRVSARGLSALLSSPHLRSLELVNLERNPIGALPAGALPSLTGLHVSRCDVTDIEAFCAGARLPRLQRLSLDGNALGPDAMRQLVEAEGLPALSWLSLDGNALGDEGLAPLLSARGLPALRSLNVRGCGLTEAGLAAHAEAPRLSSLAELSLRADRDGLGDEARERFSRAAAARGCSVDLFRVAQPTPWREVQLGPDGMPASPDDRLELARYLQTLWFVEYGDSAWLKVAPTDALSASNARHRRWRAAHANGRWRSDEGVQRGVLERFLDWMTGTLPESMSGWNRDSEGLQPISRERALEEIARIVAVSEQSADEVEGVRPWFAQDGAGPTERAPVSFAELGRWFELLFDPSEAVFFLGHGPAVLGLDQQLVAMFWLE